MRQRVFGWLLTLAAFGVAGYALFTYTMRPLGSAVHPQMQAVYETQRWGIYAHIFAAVLTLSLGPVQFSATVRRRWPRWHRFLGRVYLGLGVTVGGGAGLYMAFFAFGGWISTAGFGLLALLWLGTGWQAYRTARARQLATHRRWMIRNYALALAAVTLRIGLGLGFASGLPFEVFYPALAWLSWLANAIAAEVYLRWGAVESRRLAEADRPPTAN